LVHHCMYSSHRSVPDTTAKASGQSKRQGPVESTLGLSSSLVVALDSACRRSADAVCGGRRRTRTTAYFSKREMAADVENEMGPVKAEEAADLCRLCAGTCKEGGQNLFGPTAAAQELRRRCESHLPVSVSAAVGWLAATPCRSLARSLAESRATQPASMKERTESVRSARPRWT